jgi:hypothetical protein
MVSTPALAAGRLPGKYADSRWAGAGEAGRRSRDADVGQPPVTHVRLVGHPVDRGEVLGTGGIGALGFDPVASEEEGALVRLELPLVGIEAAAGSAADGFGGCGDAVVGHARHREQGTGGCLDTGQAYGGDATCPAVRGRAVLRCSVTRITVIR